MTIRRTFAILAPAALLLAGGCATSFRANVTRFQTMPPPQGQTFAIQAADPQNQGGIEFGMYANLVTNRLASLGYTPVTEGQPANLVVNLDYGVDNGHEKVVSTPGFGWGGFGYGGYGGGFGYGGLGWGGGLGYGRYRGLGGWGGYGGLGYGGFGGPFGYGLGGWGGSVDSYTYFVSHVDMRIRRASDSRVVFEGRARARSTDPSLQRVVPNLVDALFTGFPGRSGEDVLVTLPPPSKQGQATVRPTDGRRTTSRINSVS